MPAWISIYCKHPIGAVTPDQLKSGIRDNDYWTLAEQYNVDEDLVDPALAALQVDADGNGYQLHYRCRGERPLLIHVWDSPDRVKEEIEEAVECFENASAKNKTHIQNHLAEVQAVVGIEMGFSQLEDMGIVFAYKVARWLGQHRGGLIKDDDDNWSLIDDGAFVHL